MVKPGADWEYRGQPREFSGLSAYFGAAELIEENGSVPFEFIISVFRTAFPKSDPSRSFDRLVIAAACKLMALQFLSQEKGITASTVYPDFSSPGCIIHWQLDSLHTMLL